MGIVRRIYALLTAGDPAAVDLVAPDFVMTVRGRSAWHSLTRAHGLRNDEAVRLMAAIFAAFFLMGRAGLEPATDGL